MSQKNVLFIILDQLRMDALSCYGNNIVETTNIDRLAQRGVKFNRCYVQGTSCGNSRASFYTGRHVRSHGATWNGWANRVDEMTLADHMADTGVDTFLMGKTHMKADNMGMQRLAIDPESELGRYLGNAGFAKGEHDDGLHTLGVDGGYDKSRPAYFDYLNRMGYDGDNPWVTWANAMEDEAGVIRNGMYLKYAHLPARVDKAHSETAYTTDRAMEMIGQLGEQSWCLHLSYIKPHWPIAAPAPYHDLYKGAQLPAINKSAAELVDPNPVYKAFTETPHSQTYGVDEYRDHALPGTYGLVKELDDHLGRLFNHLEEIGQAHNTMIVLTSDHGDFYGDHWLGEKDLFHDPVTNIPLIIMDPRPEADSRRGTQCDELVCAIDLVPTFVDWAGGTPRWNWLEGKSLLPALRTDSFKGYDYVVSECDYAAMKFATEKLGRTQYNARLTMIFDGRHKFVHCLGFAPMMFDLQEDPQELVDLGRDPGYAVQRAYMSELMLDWTAGLKNRVSVADETMAARVGDSARCGILIGFWDQAAVPAAIRPPASTGVS